MYILRPNGRRRLDEQILEVCGNHDGIERRYALVLCAGTVDPENLEPFATLDRILQNTVDRELRLVVTDQWPERFWTTEVAGALDVADLEGTFELNPTLDQRRRALQQRVGDGRLEVLFIERGQVRGSALTIVAPTRSDGRPLPLNTKVAALDLLQAVRDSLPWRPRPLEQLVRDAREALGIPAGAVTSIATIRRGRGELVSDTEHAVAVEHLGDLLRQASAPGVSVGPVVPRGAPIVPIASNSRANVTNTQAPARPAPSPPPAATKAPVEERHALEQGRCVRCGKSGRQLEETCGKSELGRMGFIELD
jgi:hypothetical protein